MKRTIVACFVLAFAWACTDSVVSPTAPDLGGGAVSAVLYGESESSGADGADNPVIPDPDPDVPRQAKGNVVIQGNYARCVQSTDYPRDYLSIFRVLENGGQTRVALYKDGEGEIPCGFEVQGDCTVRDRDPSPVPSAYDLYASFVVTLACEPPSRTPDDLCDGEFLWVETGENDGQPIISVTSSQPGTITIGSTTFEFPAAFKEIFFPVKLRCGESVDYHVETECHEADGQVTHDCPPPPPICEPNGEDPSDETQKCWFDLVKCEWECVPIEPPCEEPSDDSSSDEDCVWNPDTCEYECEPVCDVDYGDYVFDGPLGNPTNECAEFGGVPGTPGFYVSKCGQSFYTVRDVPGDFCPDLPGFGWSHTTTCACEDLI